MFRHTPFVIFAATTSLIVAAGLLGCSGPEGTIEFECEHHHECLDDEACLGETCTDAPSLGDSCPADRDGREYKDLICLDGQWTHDADEVEVVAITAESYLLEPGGSTILSATIDHPAADADLDYDWFLTDDDGDWQLDAPDSESPTLEAPETAGASVVVNLEVTDPAGNEDSAITSFETLDHNEPEVDIELEPEPPLEPATDFTATADVTTDNDVAVQHYEWSISPEWSTEESGTAQTHGSTPPVYATDGTLEVTVTDEWGHEATESTEIETVDFEPRILTTCGIESGPTGPTPGDCADAYADGPLEGEVEVDEGIQTWTVPVGGVYRIDAYSPGGNLDGVRARVEIELERDREISILAGQHPEPADGNADYDGNNGGYGGTFVARTGDDGHPEPLAVAGAAGAKIGTGRTQTSGDDGTGEHTGDGGSDGQPGKCAIFEDTDDTLDRTLVAGGGGGFEKPDETPDSECSGENGESFVEGGLGGQSTVDDRGVHGGFGGGGAARHAGPDGFDFDGDREAAGGGGYSGGGGGIEDGVIPGSGGGGGSFTAYGDDVRDSSFSAEGKPFGEVHIEWIGKD